MSSPKIGLIVVGQDTMRDFQVFVRTLETWHPDAVLYVFTDSNTDIQSIQSTCKINKKIALDAYAGKTRAVMEKTQAWKEFMYEKANVLRWMFAAEPSLKEKGAWFMDADIVHMAPLPTIPENKTLALSPHYIRPHDEAHFGKYNGGFLWLKDPSLLNVWCEAGATSRYFEQAALEVVALNAKDTLHEFPIQVNFGWWRMFQSVEDRRVIQAKFSLLATDTCVGISYDGVPLQSIHTHSWDRHPGECAFFNIWFTMLLDKYTGTHALLDAWRGKVF